MVPSKHVVSRFSAVSFLWTSRLFSISARWTDPPALFVFLSCLLDLFLCYLLPCLVVPTTGTPTFCVGGETLTIPRHTFRKQLLPPSPWDDDDNNNNNNDNNNNNNNNNMTGLSTGLSTTTTTTTTTSFGTGERANHLDIYTVGCWMDAWMAETVPVGEPLDSSIFQVP